MKSSKKVLAFALAAAMVVTAVPATNAQAASTAKLSAKKATVYSEGYKTVTVKTPKSWKSVKVTATSNKKSVAKVKKTAAKKIKVTGVKPDHCRYERICSNLSGLSYILHDKLTINQQVHCFTHRCCLLYSLSVKNRVVYVKTNIISSKVWNDMEIRVLSI